MMFLRYLLVALIGANAYAYWELSVRPPSNWEWSQPKATDSLPQVEIDWSNAQLEWSKNTGDLPQWKPPEIKRLPSVEPKPKPEKPKKAHRSNEPLDIRTLC